MSSTFKKLILLIMAISCLLAVSAVHAEDAGNSTDVASQDDSSDNAQSIVLKPEKLTTTYNSGKYFKVKAVDEKTKKPVCDVKVKLKVFTGKKSKKVTVTTDSKGIAKYSASSLSVGKHKIIVTSKLAVKAKTSSVNVKKAKLKIFAPKVINDYKKKAFFKITVKNKETNKLMKGIKVLIKVFTGSKYKKYSLKTNKNGAVKFNTKSLSKGSHKVKVDVKATSKVKHASAKSTIKTVEKTTYIKIKVNGKTLNVKMENNKAAKALVDKLKKGDITVKAKEYGGFEKVGDLGFSLPANDKYITTSSGDFVLYDGDEVSLFYDSNSWDYTKLGKVQGVSSKELKNILGNGDVTLVLSLK